MRRSLLPLVVAALVFACADSPTAPEMQFGEASFGIASSYPPPPWSLIEGIISTDGGGESGASFSRAIANGPTSMSHSPAGTTARYRAWLLVTPGGQVALLRFTEGGTATFSKGAMISNVNGKVSGRGKMTVGGHTYNLGAVTTFTPNAECAVTAYDGPSCATFSAEDGSFRSQGSVWTGVLSNDGQASSPPSSCPANADYIVTNEAQLTAALAAISAGQTIAIDGVIAVTSMIPVQASNIRLTCATDGSGLIIANGSAPFPFAALHVSGNGVQVDHLFLSSVPADGIGGALHVVYVNGFQAPVTGLRLSSNRIRCGNNGTCAFVVGAPGAVVADNIVHAIGTASGLHFQQGVQIFTDNTIVERNHVIAPTVSGSQLFGAIRVRDGSQVIVRHNSTSGAWGNGISVAQLDGALIENNFIGGTLGVGIVGASGALNTLTTLQSFRNSIIRTNTIQGPQAIGISLFRACGNSVENNDISVAPGALRAMFEATTGDNVYVGNAALVVDQGAFDCDGDQAADPNTISGTIAPSQNAAPLSAASFGTRRSISHAGGTIYPELQ